MEKRPRVLVTLDGYAVEGGYDGPYQPATCFTPTISLGRHDGPGDAADLWREYERVIELVPQLGVDGIRLGVEWARIEPRRGVVDDAALERYHQVASFARGLGLDVVVTLVDQAWPSWLGLEAWLLPWTAPCVVEHARAMASAFAEVASGVVVFADRQALVTRGFLDATAPPWRRDARADALAADRQLLSICAAVADDVLVGPLLVDAATTTTVSLSVGEITRARSDERVETLFVRSLVAGTGPTGSATGLVVRCGPAWVVDADAELLAVLR